MFSPIVIFGTAHPRRLDRYYRTHLVFPIVALVAMTLSTPADAAAQSDVAPGRTWEFRTPSGAFVPTGTQRDVVKDAHVSAVQLAWFVRPQLAFTGTLAWARSRDLVTTDSPKLDVFTSDIGIEGRFVERVTAGAAFSGFAGVGTGLRSYNHRKLDVAATHHLAGYGAVGGEIARGRVGVRVEVRDYLAGFTPLVSGGDSELRNDMALMVALRFSRHAPSRDR